MSFLNSFFGKDPNHWAFCSSTGHSEVPIDKHHLPSKTSVSGLLAAGIPFEIEKKNAHRRSHINHIMNSGSKP